MMFSEQKHTCGNKYGGFNKGEEISRKDKGEQYPRAKAYGGYSQHPAKPYMTHSAYLLFMDSIPLYASELFMILCRSANFHNKDGRVFIELYCDKSVGGIV